MTAANDPSHRRERRDNQWVDYGVNVGNAVYGGIHFHRPVTRAASSDRHGKAHPARLERHAAVRSALADLARACGRVAVAMSYLRPDEAGKEE